MSNSSPRQVPTHGHRLADYVRMLVARLAVGDPKAARRLREIVGERTAAITVDDETVRVAFVDGEFEVVEIASEKERDQADGFGVTDRQTVLALLDGYLEIGEAIEQGVLEIAGAPEDVVRIGIAIEILIDGSTRIPSLQHLAEVYRNDPAAAPLRASSFRVSPHEERASRARREYQLLARLGLLAAPPTSH